LPNHRPTVAAIDLSALTYNFKEIRRHLGPECRIASVVKADAYGHGAEPLAAKLVELGTDFLAVSIMEEALELRRAGIIAPILLLGAVYPEQAETLARHRLIPIISEPAVALALQKEAEARDTKLPVHLKVDTGMGRVGVPMRDLGALLDVLVPLDRVPLEGACTHFADSDNLDQAYTDGQEKAFAEALEVIAARGVRPPHVHLSNSGGAYRRRCSLGNLARPGIMLYGSYPAPDLEAVFKLKPVMRWTTEIFMIKEYPPDSAISYGCTWRTARPSRIAVLPVGYADGLFRALSNCGQFLVRGRRAPVVGRVCMDWTMIDVTDVPGAEAGDEVVLLGAQGADAVTAEEMAEKAGTISYEIFTSVGKRVPRVYVDG